MRWTAYCELARALLHAAAATAWRLRKGRRELAKHTYWFDRRSWQICHHWSGYCQRGEVSPTSSAETGQATRGLRSRRLYGLRVKPKALQIPGQARTCRGHLCQIGEPGKDLQWQNGRKAGFGSRLAAMSGSRCSGALDVDGFRARQLMRRRMRRLYLRSVDADVFHMASTPIREIPRIR